MELLYFQFQSIEYNLQETIIKILINEGEGGGSEWQERVKGPQEASFSIWQRGMCES